MKLTGETIVRLALEVPDLVNFRSAVLAELDRYIGFEAAFFHDEGPGVPVVAANLRAIEAAALQQLASRWQELAPGYQPVLVALERETLVEDLELLGETALERTPFFAHMHRPLGLRSSMYLRLRLARHLRPSLIGVCYGRASQRMRARARATLSTLMPSLVLADAALRQRALAPARETLTPRECDLVDFVGLGLTNAEIALALGLSPNTVRNRLARLFARHQIANRAELVRRYCRHDDGARAQGVTR